MPATTVAQSVWDCARSSDLESAVVLGDAALHRELTTPTELEEMAERWRRVRGAANAGRALSCLDGASESPGESRCRLVLTSLGYRVQSQYVIESERGHYRADFWIEGTRVLVEFDGRQKYALIPDETVWREKQRADHITNLGFEIVRITSRDLEWPQDIDLMIRRALARQR